MKIVLAGREPIGLALRRFRKKLEWNGIAYEIRRHRWFIPATQIRRKKDFGKRYKSRQATELAKRAGEQ